MSPLAPLLEALIAEVHRTADSTGVDAVHDLRVSVRRATEALRLSRPQLPKARKLAKEIKSLRQLAAAVRDRDVTRQLLRRHRLPATDPALIYLQGQRDLAAQQLQAFLRDQLRRNRPQRWLRWIEAAP